MLLILLFVPTHALTVSVSITITITVAVTVTVTLTITIPITIIVTVTRLGATDLRTQISGTLSSSITKYGI
jgi:hypothetical protein